MKKMFFLLLFVLFSSCKVTTVKQDQFNIELTNDGTGGYVWNYLPANKNIMVMDSVRIPQKDSTGLTKYLKQYRFKGSQPGIYKLQFVKKRPFSKGKDTAEVIEKFWIRVKK